MKRVAMLVAGSLTLWFLLVVPAGRIWGDRVWLPSFVAVLLCVLPAALTLLWAERTTGGGPEQQVVVMLGGMGARMVVVLGLGLLLHYTVAALEHPGFWLWVLIFYLSTLALEMVLLLAGRTERSGP